jgi:hypothetical protein
MAVGNLDAVRVLITQVAAPVATRTVAGGGLSQSHFGSVGLQHRGAQPQGSASATARRPGHIDEDRIEHPWLMLLPDSGGTGGAMAASRVASSMPRLISRRRNGQRSRDFVRVDGQRGAHAQREQVLAVRSAATGLVMAWTRTGRSSQEATPMLAARSRIRRSGVRHVRAFLRRD